MPQTHTGALTGHDYTIPDLTDTAHIVTAFTGFADTIQAYPSVRLNVVTMTGDMTGVEQTSYFYNGTTDATLTLPTSPAEGDRVIAYQLGDGIVTMNPGSTPIGGGIPNTGAKFGVVSGVYHNGSWWFVPFAM